MTPSGLFDALDPQTLLAIVGLALLTLLTRSLFLLYEHPLPGWVERGLRYAPIAALAAVAAPDLLISQGQLLSSWRDARLFAALAAGALFFWRRSLLGAILVGMAVYLPLHLGSGW